MSNDIYERLRNEIKKVEDIFDEDNEEEKLINNVLEFILLKMKKHDRGSFLFEFTEKFSDKIKKEFINYVLFYSIRNHMCNLKNEAIKRGADIKEVDHKGHNMTYYGFGWSGEDLFLAAISEALRLGWNIDSKDSIGNTTLCNKLRPKGMREVKFLLENGADPYMANDLGKNAFDRLDRYAGSHGVVALRRLMDKYR